MVPVLVCRHALPADHPAALQEQPLPDWGRGRRQDGHRGGHRAAHGVAPSAPGVGRGLPRAGCPQAGQLAAALPQVPAGGCWAGGDSATCRLCRSTPRFEGGVVVSYTDCTDCMVCGAQCRPAAAGCACVCQEVGARKLRSEGAGG